MSFEIALESNTITGNSIVFVYTDWCKYCKNFKNEWTVLEKMCLQENIKTIALNFEDEKNNAFVKTYEINSFPTILLFKKNKKIKYEGERNAKNILNFFLIFDKN